MTKRLRIAIATSGRFHVLDLARELDALGHEVHFYSYVPKKHAQALGLPGRCHVTLLPFLAPLLGWQIKFPHFAPKLRERWMWKALNWAVMLRLKSCDVFICMSGVYLEAAQFARERFGAKVVLVRGSKHILAQDEILAWQSGAERPSSLAIERELAGYELADMIDVPADHVVESFRRHSAHNIHKVRKNPYGCDLPMFPLKSIQVSTVSLTKFPNFVFSGTWCLRKGCDLLCIASERAGAKLIHVGSVGSDCPLPPNSAHFEHRGWVNVSLLASTYGDCDAMVLASREDGFGVVLAQGLASGLPIVCTSDTGGADLRHTVALTDRIVIVQSGNVDALSEGMSHIAERLRGNPPLLELTETDRTTLAWQAYGERYERLLQDLLAKQVAVI